MKAKILAQPAISVVMPCYNEEECVRETATTLVRAFAKEEIPLQLVIVDNGSRDRTSEIIDELIAEGQPVAKVTVEVNCGYGNGVLAGLKVCVATFVAFHCADGQVAADDLITTYKEARAAREPAITKVRRRFRKDSWRRRLVSIFYNFGMQCAFGWLGSIDLNGNPKVISREILLAMRLESKDWFLDPEIMIKAKYLRLRIVEHDVQGQMRQGGQSNVRATTCMEFMKNILRFRFGRPLRAWKKSIRQAAARAAAGRAPAAGSRSAP